MKNPVDKVADAAKKVVEDTRDRLNEERHRDEATIERRRRETESDLMPAGEKAASIAREGKDRVLAEVDEAKRKLRDST